VGMQARVTLSRDLAPGAGDVLCVWATGPLQREATRLARGIVEGSSGEVLEACARGRPLVAGKQGHG
jgi:hypothetical protein